MKFTKKLLKIKEKDFIIIVLAIAFLLLAQNINEPFWGHHEWNGVFYSNIARNYLRYGFLKTKLGEVTNYGLVNLQKFSFHTHHPVLFPILLALFFKIFGISEWSARLFAIVFSLASLYVLNLILKKIYHFPQSSLAVLLGVLTPLFLYYARMPVYEPVITLFILLAVYNYFFWRKKQKKKYFVITTICLFTCQMIEWPGFYLSIFLFLHNLFFSIKKKNKLSGIWWLGISLISFCLISFHQYLLTGKIKGALWFILQRRLNGGSKGQPFTLWQLIRLELARTRSFFSSGILILAAIWLFFYLKKLFQRKKIAIEEHFVIFFLAFGVSHLVIFPNIAWYHDYMLYYLFPPLLLTASLGLKSIFAIVIFKRLKLLIFIIFLLLVFEEKKQFLYDLKNLNPHIRCVFWGKEIKQGLRKPILELENREDVKICPPFTNFYADRQVIFKLRDE